MRFKFCPECGYKFDKEYKFCPECGLRLEQTSQPQNAEFSTNNFSDDFSEMENLFDAQILSVEQNKKDYQKKLSAAKILILEEEYEKAEKAYLEILEDAIDDIVPNIGLLRATSKNFTVLDEKKVNDQVELLFELFGKDECLKADEDFKNFYEERELHFLELEEIEQQKIREQKRKEEELARLKRLQEEKERQLQLAKEREEKLKLKYIEDYKLAQERASQVLDMTRVGNTIYFGVDPDGNRIKWDILEEDDNIICILTSSGFVNTTYYITDDVFYGHKNGVIAELAAFRSLFNEKQKSVLCAYEFIDGGKIAKEEKIRLINTYEYTKWKSKIFSGIDFWVKRIYYHKFIEPYHWRGKDDRYSFKPFLYVSDGKLEFENKMSARCWVKPITIIDKKKLISVCGVK